MDRELHDGFELLWNKVGWWVEICLAFGNSNDRTFHSTHIPFGNRHPRCTRSLFSTLLPAPSLENQSPAFAPPQRQSRRIEQTDRERGGSSFCEAILLELDILKSCWSNLVSKLQDLPKWKSDALQDTTWRCGTTLRRGYRTAMSRDAPWPFHKVFSQSRKHSFYISFRMYTIKTHQYHFSRKLKR